MDQEDILGKKVESVFINSSFRKFYYKDSKEIGQYLEEDEGLREVLVVCVCVWKKDATAIYILMRMMRHKGEN